MSLPNELHLKPKSWVKPAENIPHTGNPVKGLEVGLSETEFL